MGQLKAFPLELKAVMPRFHDSTLMIDQLWFESHCHFQAWAQACQVEARCILMASPVMGGIVGMRLVDMSQFDTQVICVALVQLLPGKI